jgi:hypothetical protein
MILKRHVYFIIGAASIMSVAPYEFMEMADLSYHNFFGLSPYETKAHSWTTIS